MPVAKRYFLLFFLESKEKIDPPLLRGLSKCVFIMCNWQLPLCVKMIRVDSPLVRVNLVALVHFILVCNSLLTMEFVGAYIFYNLMFFITMIWTIHCKDSLESILLAFLIDYSSVPFDVGYIFVMFRNMNPWTIFFSIVNAIIRPFTACLLYKEFIHRGGENPFRIFWFNSNNLYEEDANINL